MGKLTGPDYLAGVASQAAKDGLPFASAFVNDGPILTP